MAKTKKNTNQNNRKRVVRASIPRALRLTPTGASLAAYHAALSDPFASPPTFIPTGSRPGTFVHKRLITLVSTLDQNEFKLKLVSNGNDEWKVVFTSGIAGGQVSTINWINDSGGKFRIVGAAIRVTDIGRADDAGGLATLTNGTTLSGMHNHTSKMIFKKAVTVHYKPVFPSDFTWYGGDLAYDNDGYGNFERSIEVMLDPAVASKSFVEYVLLYENDKLMPALEGAANYHIGKRADTHDAGPGTKQVARHASLNHKQRDIDMRNHNHVRGPSYIQRLSDGVRAATETGATVMGVVESLSPGTVSGPFKQYLGLGQATEAEMYGAAADAIPALEAATEFAPLMML